ncbi:hypothetical protein [Nitrosomonas sp.]|uniref:hypothetical protein n=1 Tax=Nitrosomonas sp. TaxID=42353 RepID=UPI003A5C7656
MYARNERLSGLRLIPLGDEEDPEHVALPSNGLLYTAVASGNTSHETKTRRNWSWSCPILTDSFFMESRKSRFVKTG